LFTVLLCFFCFVLSEKPKIKGLSPADHYALDFNDKEYTCKDKTKKIPFSEVNDNYCDCADGSDEPGTPACPNGKFYCRNAGYVGNEIFSTQVWDGICDCCDGSDERDKVKCKNSCHEKAAVAKQQVEKELSVQKEGLKKKQEYIEQSKKELAEKEDQLKVLQEENVKLKEKKQELEEAKRKVEELEEAKRKELEEQRAALQKQREEEALKEAENKPTEENQPPSEPTPVQAESEAQATEEEDDEDEELQPFSEETKKAKDLFTEAESALRDNENKIKDIEQILSNDYGENKAFYYMYGKSYTIDTNEYTYELNPFDKVSQKPRAGVSTSLGNWDQSKQTDAWKVSHKEMIYTDGAKCWGGPDRSCKVEIFCDADTRIAEPNEPNKCEYTLKFYTPAACSGQHLRALQLNFGDSPHHDEL